MKTTRALTAALLLAGGAAFISAAPAYADEIEPAAVVEEKVCPDLDTGHIDGNDQEEITITAPEGYLIDQICVKAGSAVQGDGPEIIDVDPPQEEYTFVHSTGKEISHYSVSYVKKTTETTPPPSTPVHSTTPVETTPAGGGDGEGKELAETGFDNGWLLFAGLGAIALGGAIAAPRIAAAKRR